MFGRELDDSAEKKELGRKFDCDLSESFVTTF
jgi:hypothetical protein